MSIGRLSDCFIPIFSEYQGLVVCVTCRRRIKSSILHTCHNSLALCSGFSKSDVGMDS
jgi:hypothetical protein